MKISKLMAFLLVATFMFGLVSAGFASTYLPTEDGKLIFQVEPGVVGEYFIYPQNLGDESQYIKIELTDPNNTIQNELEEVYEIAPNTQSDEFPIKLEIEIPSDTPIGTLFPVSYEVLTTDENPAEGIVSFTPVGFSKSFYVRAGEVTDEERSWGWLWIVGIIVFLIILAYFIVKKT